MRITEAHIKNFKGIDEWNFTFRPGFNLIKGENGKGKTSILEALAVGLGGFLAGIEGVAARHFSKEEIRRQYLMTGEGSCSCAYQVPVEVALTAEFPEQNKMISWTRGRSSIQASRSTIQPREIVKLAEQMSNQQDTCLPIICYQGAGRVWSQKRDKVQDVFRKRYTRTVGYTDTLSEASNIKLLLNWCVKMEQVAWQKETKIAEYEAVKKAVSDFMGYMDHGEQYEIFYDKQLEELMYREKEVIQPVSNLSAGYQSLIWMVFDIAYRMAVLNPFLLSQVTETAGIVLIDELDMHLHPKWQWKVIDALRQTFPKVQFIATTHAPILFASAKDVWLIDIEQEEIQYSHSHYGLDVNSSVKQYQGEYDLPEEVGKDVEAFSDAMDAEDFQTAKIFLDKLADSTSPEFPLIAGLRARYEIETSWPEE